MHEAYSLEVYWSCWFAWASCTLRGAAVDLEPRIHALRGRHGIATRRLDSGWAWPAIDPRNRLMCCLG